MSDTTAAVPLFTADAKGIMAKTSDGIDNFLTRVGLNNNNTLSASFYAFNLLTRNRTQLEAAYRGSWIVGQVIDCVAEDMTKAGINMTTAENWFDIKKMQREISRKGIQGSLCSEIKWSRLYGGAIGVLQIEGQDLQTPLRIETVALKQFTGITVYDRWQLNPVFTSVIEVGPHIGLPEFYEIVNSATQAFPMAVNSGANQTVHYSRIIRMIGIELPFFQAITEMMWGESYLERMWDRLISYDTTTMSAANLVERANNRTVKIEGFREILAAGGKAQQNLEKSFDMMREFQTNEGLTLLDKLDEFETSSYSFAGLSDLLLQFGQQLAGACGIPLVRLFGQSPAGLSATGDADLRTYYDNINSQQNAKLSAPWELILKVMSMSVFGKPLPEDFDFSFVPLWQMSDMDRAAVAKSNTETIIGAQEAGLVSTPTAMKELKDMSGDTGLFSNITDEEIEEADEMDEPPLPENPSGIPQGEGGTPPVKPTIPTPVKGLDSAWKRLKKAIGAA